MKVTPQRSSHGGRDFVPISGDDPVADEAYLARPGLDLEIAETDPLGLGIGERANGAPVDRALEPRDVGRLGARKGAAAVDEGDLVALGERQRVLDRGIAAAYDDDLLAAVFIGIVELVLDDRKIDAGNGELARIALDADREDDLGRAQRAAVGERDLEGAALPGDRGDLGGAADVGACALEVARPGLDDVPRAPLP